MGSIKRFNLEKLIAQTKATYFFETGTWKGDGLAYAAKHNFDKLYSSEIIESVAVKAQKRFNEDGRVSVINKSSIDALSETLDGVTDTCIFWLDAHFPGAEEGLEDYNAYENEDLKLPLQRELEIIAQRKHKFQDVILIDDLRIYAIGDFDSGNLPPTVLPPKVRNTDFCNRMFGDTHNIIKSLKDEGYIMILPKEMKLVPAIRRLQFRLQNLINKKIL